MRPLARDGPSVAEWRRPGRPKRQGSRKDFSKRFRHRVKFPVDATVQAVDEQEKKIGVTACPKPVQKTLKQEVGKGKLIDADVREIEGVAI